MHGFSLSGLLLCTLAFQESFAIHGGTEAEPIFSFYAFIYNESGEPFGFCGGTLISPRYVLTAGHCVGANNETDTSKYSVVMEIGLGESFGSHNKFRNVSRIVRHENFKMYYPPAPRDSSASDDIALIELSEPLPSNHTPARLSRWTAADIYAAHGPFELTALGMGRQYDGREEKTNGVEEEEQEEGAEGEKKEKKKRERKGEKVGHFPATGPVTVNMAEHLYRVDLPYIPESECRKRNITSFDIANLDVSTDICAGVNGKGITSGDSGGPLVLHTKHGYYQMGIPSYSDNERMTADFPGFFTNVAKYCDWIDEHSRGEVKCEGKKF